MKKFLRVFTILTRKQMLICSFIIFLMALCAMMEALGIGLVYPLIRIIGNPNFLSEHKKIAGIVFRFGVNTHRRLIFASSLCLLAFYIFKNFVVLYEGKLQIAFSMNNQKDYTRRLYSYYMSKPYLFLIDTNIAIVLRNINAGGTTVFCNILISVLSIITELITIFVIWSFLAIMDWMTALGIVLFTLASGQVSACVAPYRLETVAVGDAIAASLKYNRADVSSGTRNIFLSPAVKSQA